MKNISIPILMSFTVIFHSVAQDLEQPPELMEELRYLQAEAEAEFVITATRTLESIDKAGATVTVITREQIRDMGARNLMDVLMVVPGLGVTQNDIGAYEVEVRGVKTPFSEKVLFMIDSHPVNQSLVNGGALWGTDTFLVENVKRVEIVRGPGSALYGANAFLAVINVITLDHTEDVIEASAAAGTFATQKYNAFIGKEFGKLGVAVNVNYSDTNGQEEFVDGDVVGASGDILYWKEKWDFDLKLSSGNLGLHGHYARRLSGPFVGITNALNDESEQKYTDAFAKLSHQYEFSEKLTVNAVAYYDYFQLDNFWELFQEGFDNGAFPDGVLTRSAVNNSKSGIDIAARYAFNDANKLVLGVWGEHQRQWDVEFEANFDPLSFAPLDSYQRLPDSVDWTEEVTRDVWALYIEDIWDISNTLRLILGTRFDHYSDFGGTVNPRASLIWEFVKDYRLKLSYGAAFRDPTFAELFNKNNPAIVGNPDLDPESIDTFEIGVSGDVNDALTFRTTAFYNDFRDIIVPTAGPGAANIHDNKGEVEVRGVETEMRWEFHTGSYLAANYTYQDTEESGGSRLPDTPAQRGAILVNLRLPKNVNWNTRWILKDDTPRAKGDGRDDAPGYGIVNTTWRVNKLFGRDEFELRASVFNLFDRDYVDPSPAATTTADFPKPGRTVFFEIRCRY